MPNLGNSHTNQGSNLMNNTNTNPANVIAAAMKDAMDNSRRASGGVAFAPESVESDAPEGQKPSTAEQVSGNTLFDEVFNLSSVGQVQVLRTIANGALYAAIMIAHDQVSWDGPTDDDGALNDGEIRRLEYFEALPARLAQQTALYEYAAKELLPLAQTQFDRPMTFDDMFDFVSKNASRRNDSDELPDEVLEALGVTRAQLRLIDAEESKKQQAKDADLRASITAHRSNIEREVGPLVPDQGNDEVVSTLTPQQHANLLGKAAKKLQSRIAQLLALRSRYEGALGEAMLISHDAKTLDQAYASFARRNAAELRDAA